MLLVEAWAAPSVRRGGEAEAASWPRAAGPSGRTAAAAARTCGLRSALDDAGLAPLAAAAIASAGGGRRAGGASSARARGRGSRRPRGLEPRPDLPVVLGHERGDLQVAVARSSARVGVCTRPSEQHLADEPILVVAARVAFMPTSQSASQRARAASSSGRISSSSRSCVERVLDGLLGHRREPGAAHRLLVRGLRRVSQDELEDQLALASGVAGVDDHVDVLAADQPVQRLSCFFDRGVAGLVPELLRQDREVLVPPRLVLGVVGLGVDLLDQMADGEADDRRPTLLVSRRHLLRAQRLGHVGGDAWLLADDEGWHGGGG